MKLLGVGTDILNKQRIKKLIDKYHNRFPQKILSTTEIEKLDQINNPTKYISYISNRFSAKEAVVKAIGTGFIKNIMPSDIEISKYNRYGKPQVILSKQAQSEFLIRIPSLLSDSNIYLSNSHSNNHSNDDNQKVDFCNLVQIEVSISDEVDYSIAYAIVMIDHMLATY